MIDELKAGAKWVGKKALGPIGVAMDVLTPVGGGMSDEEKKYLIDEEKKFSSSQRQDNINKSIKDTKSKTLDLGKDAPPKITASDNVKKSLASGLFIDGDKGALVDSKGNLVKKLTDLRIDDIEELTALNLSREDAERLKRGEKILDELKPQMTASKEVIDKMNNTPTGRGPTGKISFSEATKEINEKISPNDKKVLDTLKTKMKGLSSAALSKVWDKIKSHPKMSLLTAAVSAPVLYGYLTSEDIEDDDSTVNDIASELDVLTTESEINTNPTDNTKTNYRDREIGRTVGGGYIFTGKDGNTRTYDTLEEAQFDIDYNLNQYYRDEFNKAMQAGDSKKIVELIKQAQERGIDLEEGLAL